MLQSVIDALNTPVAVLDEVGRLVRVNSAWRELAAGPGHPMASCGPGDSYPEVCAAAVGELTGATALQDGLRRVLAGRQSDFGCDCRLIQDGAPRDFRMRISRLDHHVPARFLVEHEEVTVLVQAQQAVHEAGERLLEVQAGERQRLAVELHDSVGQNLVSLGLSLSLLRMVAPKTHGVASIISDMAVSLQEAHAQIRSLTYLLNPPWPEHDGGLENAVKEFALGFGRRAGLRVEIRLSGPPCEVDRARELAVFRILQEALVNVHRHAHANAVLVELVNRGHEVTLQVRDDGRGFSVREGTTSPLGVGISGMRARVRERGGDLKIVTGPTGTSLTVRLPIGAAAEASDPCSPGSEARPPSGNRPARIPLEDRSWDPQNAQAKIRKS